MMVAVGKVPPRRRWLRWPRLTVRRLMILVAVAGLATGAEVYRRHLVSASGQYRYAASMCRLASLMHEHAAFMAESEREDARMFPEAIKIDPATAKDDQAIAKSRRLAAHYGRLAAKYERATVYPWLTVAPGPPEPE